MSTLLLKYSCINYRMAQPTEWVPAILDYMKKVRLNISTVVLAQISSSDSLLVVNRDN